MLYRADRLHQILVDCRHAIAPGVVGRPIVAITGVAVLRDLRRRARFEVGAEHVQALHLAHDCGGPLRAEPARFALIVGPVAVVVAAG